MTKKKMGAKKISSTKKKKTVRYIISYLKNLKKKKKKSDWILGIKHSNINVNCLRNMQYFHH